VRALQELQLCGGGLAGYRKTATPVRMASVRPKSLVMFASSNCRALCEARPRVNPMWSLTPRSTPTRSGRQRKAGVRHSVLCSHTSLTPPAYAGGVTSNVRPHTQHRAPVSQVPHSGYRWRDRLREVRPRLHPRYRQPAERSVVGHRTYLLCRWLRVVAACEQERCHNRLSRLAQQERVLGHPASQHGTVAVVGTIGHGRGRQSAGRSASSSHRTQEATHLVRLLIKHRSQTASAPVRPNPSVNADPLRQAA
jgi:hypothetical protein